MKSAVSIAASLTLALAPTASAALRVSAQVPGAVSFAPAAGGAALGSGASLAPHFSAAPGMAMPSLYPSAIPSNDLALSAASSLAGHAGAAARPNQVGQAAASASERVKLNSAAPGSVSIQASKAPPASALTGITPPYLPPRTARQREEAAGLAAPVRPGQSAAPGLPSLRDGLLTMGKKALKDKHFDADFDGARPDSDKYDVDAFRIRGKKGGAVDLSRRDPSDVSGFKDKGERGNKGNKAALKLLAADSEALQELQNRLYAGRYRSVLIVLQAMDTAGKDGVLRHVLGPLDPQGVKVTSFKKPTQEEIDNGYLWRIRRALPEPGFIAVFNRSQYEDILVPSVLGGTDAKTIERRYGEINAFEKKLADEGVLVLKFFLHIDKAEQKARLQARLDDPTKQWKFDKADLKMRAKWDDFQKVYGRILARTSTAWAPWYLIPSNNKWFRNFLVGRILRHAMEAMGLKYPEPEEGLEDIVIPD